VHFNRGRTVAAVRVGSWCGGLCGLWIWRVVEKKDGHWQELDLDGWRQCITVAGAAARNPIRSGP